MYYIYKDGKGEHIVEKVHESGSFLTMREVALDGSVNEFRKKKPVNLTSIPDEESTGVGPSFDYWVTEPFQHQKDFLKYAETHRNFLLLDEPGLGKTKQSLDLIMNRKRHGLIKRALIVSCVSGLQYNWLNEVKKHTDLKGYILGTRPKKKNSTLTVIGSNADKLFDLKNAKSDILICNIEMLRNNDIVKQLQLMCASGDIGQIVIDEIHKCKNGGAKQTAGLFSLHPKYKLGLTGTPIINAPMDLFEISYWMAKELRSLSDYKAAYCIMGGFRDKEVVGYQNLDELHNRLMQWSLRRLKEECLDLPEKTVQTIYVDLTDRQKWLYQEIRKDIRDRVEDIMLTPDPMSRFIGLRKVTSCPPVVLEDYDPENCAKFQELLRIIQECLDNGHKIVVYTWFVFTLQYLNTMLQRHGIRPALIYGSMSLEERTANEMAFQGNPECKVMLGNYQSMGTGRNLYAANTVVEYEMPWTSADEIQGQDRCHRIGQTNNLTCIRLLTRDTVDERVCDIVDMKTDLSDKIVNRQALKSVIERTLYDPV